MVSKQAEDVLIGAAIGFLAGLSVAIGGAIKDAPVEGFKPVTFLRSLIIGMVEGAIINGVAPKTNKVLVYLSTIGSERITVESWKLIRSQVPSKFENGEWGRPIMEISLQRAT